MVKKHIAPGGFPFAENAILEGLEGDEYMRRTIEEIQQSTAKMRAKRESSMAHEIAKIRMRQDAVAARRGPPPRPQYPRYEPFSGVRKQPGGAHLDTEYEALLAQLPSTTARNHGWHRVPRLAPPTPGQLARPARSELERLRRQFPNSTQREFGDHWDFRPEKARDVAEGVATASRLTARRVASDPHLAGAIAVLRERVDLLDRRGRTIGDRGVTHASATKRDTAIVREKKWDELLATMPTLVTS